MTEQARPNAADIEELLEDVIDPCSVAAHRPMGLRSMRLISRVDVTDNHVDVVLLTTSPFCDMAGYFFMRVEDVITAKYPDFTVHVDIDLTTMWPGLERRKAPRPELSLLRVS